MLQKSISFLGHVVSGNGVSTDLRKIKAVRYWPNPRTAKEVRNFLGLYSYYRWFIPGFAGIARPLHKLTEEGRERGFIWDIGLREYNSTHVDKGLDFLNFS